MPHSLTIIIGGVHPTICTDEVIKNTDFDFIMRGESEYTFLEFMQNKPYSKINGLSYRNPHPIHNPEREFIKNLNTLPFPDHKCYVNNSDYIDYSYIITTVDVHIIIRIVHQKKFGTEMYDFVLLKML